MSRLLFDFRAPVITKADAEEKTPRADKSSASKPPPAAKKVPKVEKKVPVQEQPAANTRRSWRDKMAAAKDSPAKVAEPKKEEPKVAVEAEVETSSSIVVAQNGDENNNESKPTATAADEDDDFTGTKAMRKDVNSLFSNMEAEFEAGKSKLAKLRERIRKAKGVIKAADEAVENSK